MSNQVGIKMEFKIRRPATVPVHYWISYCARQALGVPQPQSKGPPGPGGHNNLSNSVLEGLLYFISPLYGQNLCLF